MKKNHQQETRQHTSVANVPHAAAENLVRSLARIENCVRQLSESQIRWRPATGMNSIGQLIKHLAGNLQEWVIEGLSRVPSTRNRDAEFDESVDFNSLVLLEELQEVVARSTETFHSVWQRVNTGQETDNFRIQGLDRSLAEVLMHCTSHFCGHAFQIVMLTRTMLGNVYQFEWLSSSERTPGESDGLRLETGRLRDTGFAVKNWHGAAAIPSQKVTGVHCALEPVDINDHGNELAEMFVNQSPDSDWTYLAYGPFDSTARFLDWLSAVSGTGDPQFVAIRNANSDRVAGLSSYLNCRPESGVVEIGHIHFGPQLQRTTSSTESIYLMLKTIFDDCGYRRCEWKCDACNVRSRNAATRFGFHYEGTFAHHWVYKERNRDSAWFSITDRQWPAVKQAFNAWLDPSNFVDGRQQTSLRQLMTLKTT